MKARYITSALTEEEWPRLLSPRGEPLPEVALVGRSNVGKSTLVNLLTEQKKLAKVSSIPGKTQRLQFFVVDEAFALVDLPGYGFAKAPKNLQVEWSSSIDCYLKTRESCRLIGLLLDSRRELSKDDLLLIEWANSRNLAVLPIFTKTDLLTKNELRTFQARAKEQMRSLVRCEPFFLPAPGSILLKVIYAHLTTGLS